MKQIIYTYDESRPTNKDYLIAALTDSIDDDGASLESVIEYDIDCPYIRSSDCYNDHFGNEYNTAEYKEGCVKCKTAWLKREYDTYPSYDGIWEADE